MAKMTEKEWLEAEEQSWKEDVERLAEGGRLASKLGIAVDTGAGQPPKLRKDGSLAEEGPTGNWQEVDGQ